VQNDPFLVSSSALTDFPNERFDNSPNGYHFSVIQKPRSLQGSNLSMQIRGKRLPKGWTAEIVAVAATRQVRSRGLKVERRTGG